VVTRALTEFDVSGALGEPAVVAASIIAPDRGVAGTVVVAVPGGGYTRSYWDQDPALLPSYSFAEHLAGAGYAVVAVDNVGTGASTVPRGHLTPEQMAAALHVVSTQVRERIADESLAPAGSVAPDSDVVGIGHSLGGMLVALQQGAHASYDRVGIWGMTAVTPPGTSQEDLKGQIRASMANLRATADADTDAQFVLMPRLSLRPFFYGNFVAEAVMEADESAATTMSLLAGASAGAHGYIAEAAAQIAVPVLLAFGEEDLSADPRGEPAAYGTSEDLTVFVLRGSAHCHNLAPTRHRLWDRTIEWLRRSPAQ
jgi:alpha-beta hydrolase superfamily lysophospholipase